MEIVALSNNGKIKFTVEFPLFGVPGFDTEEEILEEMFGSTLNKMVAFYDACLTMGPAEMGKGHEIISRHLKAALEEMAAHLE